MPGENIALADAAGARTGALLALCTAWIGLAAAATAIAVTA